MSADEGPVKKLFLLVEEVFDLHRKSQLIRQGNFAVLKKIFETFFGIRVNKMIINKVLDKRFMKPHRRFIIIIVLFFY